MQGYSKVVWTPHLWPLMGSLLFFSCLPMQLRAFSIDAENPVIYSGPEGSYFGFSVEFYKPEASVPGILIGAPKANTTQENVTEGGAVFLCPWSSNGNWCNLIPFDTKGERYIRMPGGVMMDHKSNQWFGATVKAHKKNVVACAPMYHWKYELISFQSNKHSGDTPVGTCLVAANNFSSYAEYSPCRSNVLEEQITAGAPDQRFCEAGWSSELTEGGEILMGAPGSFFWQGQLIAINIQKILQNYNYNNPLKVLKPKQTKDAKGKQDNAFMGYSVALGEFTGDSVKEYIIGAPRGKNTLGSVIILHSTNLSAIQNIIGEQMAAYFGYTVAALDINADGRDDILVGAPLFMTLGQDGKLHEVGRFYVYLQEQPGVFKEPPQIFTGTDKFGRFGSAITSLGDLDYDGYKDVAVGAPFAGQDGNGRVFIYLGHATGLYEKPFQELKGTWAPDVRSAGFGFSLRGGSDIDANSFPDLIVGAYAVDKVLLYRTKPVIAAEVKLMLTPNILNPKLKACKLAETQTPVTCFEVKTCVTVKGHAIPQNYVLNARLELDKPQRRTLFLTSHQSQQIVQFSSMKDKETSCRILKAYLRNEAEFKDKLSPIVVTLNFSRLEEIQNSSSALSLVLSPHSRVLITEKARILLNCGSDNICIPDFKLSANADRDHFIIGDFNQLTVIFAAVNDGEGGYETELYISLPPQIDFTNVVQGNKSLSKLPCNPLMDNGTQTVICQLGNPMESNVKLTAGLHFTVHSLAQQEGITISMQIRSKNSQKSHSDMVHLNFKMKTVAHLVLRGVSQPEQVVLPSINLVSPSNTVAKNISLPVIDHVYELHNNGPTTISRAIIEIDWPANFNGDNLLIKSMIVPWGEIKCTVNSSDADNWAQPLTTVRPSTTENIRRRLMKRDVSESETLMVETTFNLTCDNSQCVKILCQVGHLESKKGAGINIQSSLKMEPFLKNNYKKYTFQSEASFILQEMPYQVQPEHFPSGNTMVKTIIEHSELENSRAVKPWWIIVAVVGGLLLVALVTFILWKCGFFKRKLPPKEEEELL
ncbi:integrin alpha-8-like [Narcine bancroftii]|uniref:integrin alpha-8-like n=1 Tax=Narcine bancroftii TaxID=1343680 RepID=UPI0038312992